MNKENELKIFQVIYISSIPESICYDDACHLKKFSQNPVRSKMTTTSKRMATMEMVVDKFHFRNHVDGWCKANCNPHKSNQLQVTVMS